MERKYAHGGGRVLSSNQSSWYWPNFGDTFWSFVNVIFLFFKTLVSPGKGDSSSNSSSRRGHGPGPPGGPRRMGRINHGGGGPSPPPMGGGG